MSKFMISGFYGAGNVGDEAILEAMLTRIVNKHKDAECYVISKNQKATKADHNVETIGRNDFSGFFKHLLSTDVLISGGGSLLQDVTSKKSLAYYIGIIFSFLWARLTYRTDKLQKTSLQLLEHEKDILKSENKYRVLLNHS